MLIKFATLLITLTVRVIISGAEIMLLSIFIICKEYSARNIKRVPPKPKVSVPLINPTHAEK